MNNSDYYQVMGVAPDASAKDIKMAYRRLARKYHPDLNKAANAEEQFKALGEAYDVLGDAAKRKAYDQSRLQPQSAPFEAGYGQGFGDSEFNADLCDSLFSGGGFGRQTRPQSHPGADRQGTLRITLEDAYQGTVKSIQVPSTDPKDSSPRALKVTIPAGIRHGKSIRLAGLGEPGVLGGPRGDMYLTIEIEKHPWFDVLGDDIYLTLPVTPWEVALGTTVKVPTLAGVVELKIPAGSQGGQKLRLKQRGLPSGANRGNQVVLLKVMVPTPKTDADKACFTAMAEHMPFNPRKLWEHSHG